LAEIVREILETEHESVVMSLVGGSLVNIVIPVFNAYDDFVRCIESVERNTDDSVAVLIVDDAGGDRRFLDFLRRVSIASNRQFVILENAENLGFVRSCNRAFRATGYSDVALVNSDVVVGAEWLSGLVDAAASSNLVATVSTLTNHGTILSTPVRNRPYSELSGSLSPDSAASLVFAAGLGVNPTIPTAVGHCLLIRRIALQLLGGFDEKYGKGYGEEVDFSLRAVQSGLRNVVADKVFTYHRGNGSFGAEGRSLEAQNDKLVRSHFPWYEPWMNDEQADMHSPLADALAVSANALRGLHLGVDARCLGPSISGTQRVVLETIRSLSAVDDVARLLVYLPGEIPSYVSDFIGDSSGVDFVTPADSERLDLRCDVIYRPYQLQHPSELEWLRRHGNRVVLNQLDLISYNNPAYSLNYETWSGYRELTKLALSSVDGVAFISEHARSEALAAGVVGEETLMRVIGCGVDSGFDLPQSAPPRGFPLDELPLILCLGNSYHHKNRVWALNLFKAIKARGWSGRLVLAGATPPEGNSLGDEAEFMLRSSDLVDHVTFMGGVSEAEKQWLMDRSALVLFPTLVEGFGLMPFEAAVQGIPVLTTRQGSLDEVLPEDLQTIDDLDLESATELAFRLLTDSDAANAAVRSVQTRALDFVWSKVALQIVELAQLTLTRPGRSVVALNAQMIVDWYDGIPSTKIEKEDRPSRYWLEQFLGWRPTDDRLLRYLLPQDSKRQTAWRQLVNHVRARLPT